MIPNWHLVDFVMEMLYNRSFTLKTSDGKISRSRRLKNGVSKGSILAPLLFSVYIKDIPQTISQQYGYADDLALLFANKNWNTVEFTLGEDLDKDANCLNN